MLFCVDSYDFLISASKFERSELAWNGFLIWILRLLATIRVVFLFPCFINGIIY